MSRPGDPKAIAAGILESAEIQQYYDVSVKNDGVRLTLRDSAFRDQYPLRSDDFALRVSLGSRALTVPLPLERFRAVGTLLPLLAGNHGDTDIAAGLEESLDLDEQEWSRIFLATLDREGFLQRARIRPNNFSFTPARPRVTYVGHTSILLQTPGATILTDPLLRNLLKSPMRAFDITRLDLNAICCTHSHWDHCDVETLLRFDKRIPVIIPRVHEPTAFNPPIAPVLRRLGFQDIRELDPWESQQLGDVEMIAVPFHGEQDEPDATIDHYTYVYRTKDLTLYGGVDAYRDSWADMNDALVRVRDQYRPSVAFLPISRMIYRYDEGGVNGFCRSLDHTLLSQSFQYTAGPQEAVEWVRLLGVSTVVPYATFMFSPYATPSQLKGFAAALDQNGLKATLLPLRPLDALDLSDLDGSARAALRRRLLWYWHRGVAAHRFARHHLLGAIPRGSSLRH
jgi:L-ascorbate metabolism protein UlaG (beta-lactamase superfamily)